MAGNKAIFEIRPEKPSDVTDIFDLTQRAFAPMQFSDGSEPACVNALRLDGDLALSLVAVVAGAIVGHVAFSPATVQGTKNGWFGLGPVSVDPDFQGQGIGSALIEQGLAELRQRGASGCLLIGDPGFYCRFGFEGDVDLTYRDLRPDIVQALAFSGNPPVGEIVFARGLE